MKYASVSDIESLPNEFPLFDTIEEATKDNLYPYLIEVEDKNQIKNLKDFQFDSYDVGNRVVIKLAIKRPGVNKSKTVTTNAFEQILGTPLAEHILHDDDDLHERHIPDDRNVNFYAVDIIHPKESQHDVKVLWGKPDPRHEDLLAKPQGLSGLYAGVKRRLAEKRDENGQSLVGQPVPPATRYQITKTLGLPHAAGVLSKTGSSKAYVLDPEHDYPHRLYALKKHAGDAKLSEEQLDEMAKHHADLIPQRQFDENGQYLLSPTKKELKEHAIRKSIIDAYKILKSSKKKETISNYFQEVKPTEDNVLDLLHKITPGKTFSKATIEGIINLHNQGQLTPGKFKNIVDTNNKDLKKHLDKFKTSELFPRADKLITDAKNWYKTHTGEDTDIKADDVLAHISEIKPLANNSDFISRFRQHLFDKIYNPKYAIEFRTQHAPKHANVKFQSILGKPVPIDMVKSKPLISEIMHRVRHTYDDHKKAVKQAVDNFQSIESSLKHAFENKSSPETLRMLLDNYETSFAALNKAQRERDAMLVTYLYAKLGIRPGYNEKSNAMNNEHLEERNDSLVNKLSRLDLGKSPDRGAALLELGDVDLSIPEHVGFNFPGKSKSTKKKTEQQAKTAGIINIDPVHDPFLHNVFKDKTQEINDRANFEKHLGKNIGDENTLYKLLSHNPEHFQRLKNSLLNRPVGTPSKHLRLFNHTPEDFRRAFGLNSKVVPAETPMPEYRSFVPLMKAIFGDKYNTKKIDLTPYDFRRHVFTNMGNLLGYKVGLKMAHTGQPLLASLSEALKEVKGKLTAFTSHGAEGSLDSYLKPGQLEAAIIHGFRHGKEGLNIYDEIKNELGLL